MYELLVLAGMSDIINLRVKSPPAALYIWNRRLLLSLNTTMTLSTSHDLQVLTFISITKQLLACIASRRNHMELLHT